MKDKRYNNIISNYFIIRDHLGMQFTCAPVHKHGCLLWVGLKNTISIVYIGSWFRLIVPDLGAWRSYMTPDSFTSVAGG